MIPAELVVVLAFMLLIVGGGATVYYSRLTKLTVAISILAGLMLGWVGAAAYLPHPVVDISYHPVVQQRLPNGTYVDIIAVTDEDGDTHVVNLDKAIGQVVPKDGGNYQVARIGYSGQSLGLRFRDFRRYQIIPLK